MYKERQYLQSQQATQTPDHDRASQRVISTPAFEERQKLGQAMQAKREADAATQSQFGGGGKQHEKEAPLDAVKRPKDQEPDALDEVWEKGKQIAVFQELAMKVGITDLNYRKIIKLGWETSMDPGTGTIILLQSRDTDDLIVDLMHEMTNLLHRKEHHETQKALILDKISPKEYAKRVVAIEAEGMTNQVIVASNLEGYAFQKDSKASKGFMDIKLEEYRSGKLSDKKLKAEMKAQAPRAKIGDTGESAIEFYMREGQDLQDTYRRK
jgi:hypothetical protein